MLPSECGDCLINKYMRKITAIFYLDQEERSSYMSQGILLVLDDGSKLELMSTDIVGHTFTPPDTASKA